MEPRLKIGLVGFGRWGRKLGRALLTLPQVELLGVCDVAFKDETPTVELGTVAAYSDFATLLSCAKIDALVVATPPESHAALTRAGLERGLHVFVEKPMALRVSDAEILLSCAQHNERILMVGHILHHDAAVALARSSMSAGLLGNVSLCLSQRINVAHDLPLVAPLASWWDLAPHDIALFLRALGSFDRIAVASKKGIVDATVECAQGAARLSVGYGQERVRRTAWVGDQGALCIQGAGTLGDQGRLRLEQLRLRSGALPILERANDRGASMLEVWALLDELVEARSEMNVPAVDALHNELRHFADCALTSQAPLSDGAEGLKVVKVLAAGEALLLQQPSTPLFWEAEAASA